ncbi:MAG: ERCC4 domain-containing protein [Candidatus Schekmanbacteria bacterium]|nr:ERCC4 domain-containing protein [Candidatus Schekmanbacteria bacterium]
MPEKAPPTWPSKPVIVIDSREQLPFSFADTRAGSVVRALPAGDYSLEGFEGNVAIERKSLTDFVSTVVHERTRFEAELQKLKGYEHAWVIVEGSLEDVLSGNYRSKITPQSLLGITTALMTDYIPILFAHNRACARALTEALLLRCYKRMIK